MTTTSQLEAHYAVLQLDALRHHVVLSFQPTADLLIAEIRERSATAEQRRRLLGMLRQYRASLLTFDGIVVAMRDQCGTNRDDLPECDDDVRVEVERLRRLHAADIAADSLREAAIARCDREKGALETMLNGGAA